MTSITIYYEEGSDVAYFKLNEFEVAYSKILADNRWADFTKDGIPVGLQLFDVSKTKFPLPNRSLLEKELVRV